MFGTIVVNRERLGKADRDRYMQHYCGLCTKLEQEFGSIGCQSLTYDMTFLAILLSSLYGMEEQEANRRCMPNPRKHHYIITPATAYAADMNIALAYYQCLDDWHDDHNLVAKKKAGMLEKCLPKVRQRAPGKLAHMEGCLAELGAMEQRNELNPDLPANCFGDLMAELFVWQEDEYAPLLRSMGAALGRFIYLLDAVNDLKADIKKQRYNPLVAQMDIDFTPVLTMMMAECTQSFEALPIERDKRILQNVLYTGVWQSYIVKKRGSKTDGEKPI